MLSLEFLFPLEAVLPQQLVFWEEQLARQILERVGFSVDALFAET